MKETGVTPIAIKHYLEKFGWKKTTDEGMLMLLELISKAGAGYYNSCTEELFMNSFGLLTKNRMPNRKGMRFISSMVYSSSNKKPKCYGLMKEFRS